MKHFLVFPLAIFAGAASWGAITPNMELDKPVTGETNYAEKINAIFNKVDAHDHSTGKGVLISSSGLATSAVTTVKINDGAVTESKLATDSVVTGKILDSAVTSAKILDGTIVAADLGTTSVVTAKIADGNVTRAKLVSVGQQISGDSGTFTTTSTSLVDVTNLSVTITTTGRPVVLELNSEAGFVGQVGSFSSGGFTSAGKLHFLRGAVNLGSYGFKVGVADTEGQFPPGAFRYVDTPTAGTYTYKVQAAATTSSTTINVTRCHLVAYEL